MRSKNRELYRPLSTDRAKARDQALDLLQWYSPLATVSEPLLNLGQYVPSDRMGDDAVEGVFASAAAPRAAVHSSGAGASAAGAQGRRRDAYTADSPPTKHHHLATRQKFGSVSRGPVPPAIPILPGSS